MDEYIEEEDTRETAANDLGFWGESIIDKVVETSKNLVGPAIDNFRGKVIKWHTDYKRLKADKTKLPPALAKEREALLRDGERIIKIIETLGIDLNQEAIEKNLGAIFIPIIAAAAAGGVLAYIATWYYKDRQHKRNVKAYHDARKSGATHTQALEVVKKTGADAGTLKFSTKLIIGAVALGALYLYLNKRGGA